MQYQTSMCSYVQYNYMSNEHLSERSTIEIRVSDASLLLRKSLAATWERRREDLRAAATDVAWKIYDERVARGLCSRQHLRASE